MVKIEGQLNQTKHRKDGGMTQNVWLFLEMEVVNCICPSTFMQVALQIKLDFSLSCSI